MVPNAFTGRAGPMAALTRPLTNSVTTQIRALDSKPAATLAHICDQAPTSDYRSSVFPLAFRFPYPVSQAPAAHCASQLQRYAEPSQFGIDSFPAGISKSTASDEICFRIGHIASLLHINIETTWASRLWAGTWESRLARSPPFRTLDVRRPPEAVVTICA